MTRKIANVLAVLVYLNVNLRIYWKLMQLGDHAIMARRDRHGDVLQRGVERLLVELNEADGRAALAVSLRYGWTRIAIPWQKLPPGLRE